MHKIHIYWVRGVNIKNDNAKGGQRPIALKYTQNLIKIAFLVGILFKYIRRIKFHDHIKKWLLNNYCSNKLYYSDLASFNVWVINFDVLLIVRLCITLVNDQLDAQFFYFIIRLLQSSTCFEQRRAHHQEVKFYYYSIWHRHSL